MKKTIKDLKIGDTIYYLNSKGATNITETSVSLLSFEEIRLSNREFFKMNKEDYSRFNFTSSTNYNDNKTNCYLDRNDLLQKILANAKDRLLEKQEEFKNYIESIKIRQQRILEIEFEIANII